MTDDELRKAVAGFEWYHTIRLTDTVVTPGWSACLGLTQLVCSCVRALDLKGKRVLDIDCRDGLMSFEAEKGGASEVIAIDNDLSRGAVEFLIPFLRSKVRMHELNLYDLRPTTFGLFDVIIFPGVMYHLRYPIWGINVVRQVLKPGGTLVLETAIVVDDDRHALLYCPTGDESPYEATSCTFFNRKGAIDTMKTLGFEVKKIEPLVGRPSKRLGTASRERLGNRVWRSLRRNAVPVTTPEARAQELKDHLDRIVFTCEYKPALVNPRLATYWDGVHRFHTLQNGNPNGKVAATE
jgi:SAM-dependent methyltransferase